MTWWYQRFLLVGTFWHRFGMCWHRQNFVKKWLRCLDMMSLKWEPRLRRLDEYASGPGCG